MAERIGTVEHRRRFRAQWTQRVAPGEQVAHERFPSGNQLVREHVPRPRLEPAVAKQRRELGATLGPDREIVVEDDRLSVEQEARIVRRWIVEQLVDEGNEPVTEAARWMVPLPVPMSVGDDE